MAYQYQALVHLLNFHLLLVHSVELDLLEKHGTDNESSPVGELNSQVYCPNDVLHDLDYGDFEFPETIAATTGTFVRIPCPYGFRNDGFQPIGQSVDQVATIQDWKKSRSGATRSCYLETSLEQDDDDGDHTPKQIGVWKSSKIDYCKQEDWEENLAKWLNWVKEVTVYSFSQLGPYTTLITRYVEDEDYDFAEALINGLAELLTSPALNGEIDGVSISQQDRNRLFDTIESFTQLMAAKVYPGYKFQAGKRGITVETVKFSKRQHFSLQTDGKKNSYSTIMGPLNNPDVSVDIPSEALEMAIEQKDGNPQLTITSYSHDIFDKWAGDNISVNIGACLPITPRNSTSTCDDVDEDGGCEGHIPPFKASGLLCIELEGDIENLTEHVEFFLSSSSINTEHLEDFRLNCVYWDEEEKLWSTKGVTTTQLEDGIKCTASHLTAFSALLEPLPLPFPGAEYAPINNSVHVNVLSILSSIGSAASVVGLGLTLFTYALFSSLRRERSNRILINLSSSLLLMHIMALSGSRSLWDGHCFVPALSIHYLVLTSLAWMMVEAIHMFDLLISVFVRPERRFLIKRIILAWGIPLIIVAICGAVQPQVYKDGRADLCLMNAHENIYLYYGAFIIPICVMLLINLIIFCRIFRVLYNQTKRTKGMANPGNPGNKTGTSKLQFVKISPLQIKGALAVMVLLGIGWIFGLVAMGPFEVFFRYMFVVANAGQGLLIFLFRVVLNPQACKQWKKVMFGLSPEGSLDASVTNTSTVSEKRGREKVRGMNGNPTFISEANSVENSLTPSNPMSKSLAASLVAIMRAENERARSTGAIDFG